MVNRFVTPELEGARLDHVTLQHPLYVNTLYLAEKRDLQPKLTHPVKYTNYGTVNHATDVVQAR